MMKECLILLVCVQIGKNARDHKKFGDYNDRVTNSHKSRVRGGRYGVGHAAVFSQFGEEPLVWVWWGCGVWEGRVRGREGRRGGERERERERGEREKEWV